ncbi:hypothetical protein JB92DRAFT_2847008, partial [Gautieria morchelliformis]
CCFLVVTWLIYPVNNFQLPEAALPDHNRAITETNLNATKDALELEKTLFDEEKSAWTTNTNAQKKKQALIQRGATIMFRMHRLEAQQEREAMQALEDGLLQTGQQELDVINREEVAATSRANAISDRLTEELDKLTEKVNVRSAELDALVSRAQAHVSRFSSAAEAIGLAREGIYLAREKANLAEGHARVEHSHLVKKEMARARAASLQAARVMRNESSRTLHKLVSTSDNLVKNVTSTVEDQKNDKVDGVMSRGPSLQAISGTTSSIDGIEGSRAGGLQKSRMPSTRHAVKQKPPRLATFPTFPLLNP